MFVTEIAYEIPQQYTYQIVETKYCTVPIEITYSLILQIETGRYSSFISPYESSISEILKNKPLDLKNAQRIFPSCDLNEENYGFL